MNPATRTPPRGTADRVVDVREALRTQRHLWLSTARDDRAHLVPLSYVWDGTDLLCTTKAGHRTVRNLRASGTARAAVGSAVDVVLVDARVTVTDPATAPPPTLAALGALPLDPARVPGVVLLTLRPVRISTWRGMAEMPDRVVMEDGVWL